MTIQNFDPTTLAMAQVFSELLNKAGGVPMQKAGGTPQGPYLHGPGGLFGVLGLDQPIISTHLNIGSSLAAALPVRSSKYTDPLFPYITGFVRSDTQEKNGVCDTPEEAGNMKTCILTTQFGRKEFKTRELEVNRIGQLRNRGEFDDLRIVNSPLVQQMAGILTQRFALQNVNPISAGQEMVARFLEVGVAFQRWLCPQTYTGNPANSSANGGYQEFPGLDLTINTGKIDAIAGSTCPSLDSLIRDYGNYDVQDTSAPYNIVHVITSMFRFLRKKAEMQDMLPVDWKLSMRSGLFDAITDVWPCQYNTYRCQISGQSENGAISLNDDFAVRMRDEMRTGKYLLVDGARIGVITDDCITEETYADNSAIPTGSYASDIYFVPFSIRGGQYQTTYWEFYDYREDVLPAISDANASMFFWSDSGRFLWGIKPPYNWCIDAIAKMEPRLINRTPQLAARLTNVAYTPLIHYTDPLPSQPYWVDGGNPSGYPAPSPYSEWNPAGPGGQ